MGFWIIAPRVEWVIGWDQIEGDAKQKREMNGRGEIGGYRCDSIVGRLVKCAGSIK